MSQTYTCSKGCCPIHVKAYPILPLRRRTHSKKAGAFMYDPDEDRVLLVQSRGQLWGPPKGTLELELKETVKECAIREVKEETGLDISGEDFTTTILVNRAVYFYIERKSEPVSIQEGMVDNDANGIAWIKIECLQDCIQSGKISLNYQCKQLFRKIFRVMFPKIDAFIPVRRKH